MDFVHLHVHSHYSLLNGLTQIKPLVKTAKERGFKALALTDYGVMYGAIEFYQTCLKEGIKPIVGFEAYLVNKNEEIIYNLILLAENFNGYQNLMRLSSWGHLYGLYKDKPCLNKEILKKYSQNIIALSGPIEGEIPQALKKGDYNKAKQLVLDYKQIFTDNNFYLELQDHPEIEGQMQVNIDLIRLSKETQTDLVVTRDVHYLNPNEAEAQDILRCIDEGWTVNQTNRENKRHIDRSLNTAEDIYSRFRHIPEALENTVKIADKINLEIPLGIWHFAPVELPPGKTADDVLREKAYENLPKFFDPITTEVKERLNYELDVIKTKGYSPYFLCVADYVHYAKSHGIVQTTRGSSAGSLVSYVIGITTVDPIRFKLPFERFLNPYRPSPPDIDTDFADDRREDMIEYVTKKYGSDKVAQIITFGTMAARASIRDVGRVLGYSYSFCDQVAKLIPIGSQGFHMTIDKALEEEPDLKKLYDSNPEVKKLLDLARKVEGCARHTSIHAAGVVISPTPLTDFTPVQKETGGDKIITQYEMHSVESAGVLKMDFLGIRNLSILGKAVEIVEKTTGEKVDIYSLPLDDKETFEMLSRGETMGTFQLSGSGMTRWLKELRPTRIDDLMAMIALFRPGPMAIIPEYIARKQGKKPVTYYHPKMEKFLDKSYGLLVYQDDLLFTAIELAGYDWTTVDKFRKAVGKKIPEEMAKQHVIFVDGCQKHSGMTKAEAEKIWTLFEPFQGYGFNKAHAASYGIVAYQTSYMKAHFPVQYMTAVLQAESGDADKVFAIVNECRRLGIEVLPPDVNESFKNFAMVSKPGERGRIRFGLNAIKNVGEHICEVIYRERKENGHYKSLEDFLERINDKDLNKKSIESLAKAGALDCFGYDRQILVDNIDNILNYLKQHRENLQTNQDSLFSVANIEITNKVLIKQTKRISLEQKLRWEKELLGIYLSDHPFSFYAQKLKGYLTNLNQVEETERNKWLAVGGVIEKAKKKITKNGGIMMFVTLVDTSGILEILVFPKTYEKTKDIWQEGQIVCVTGKSPAEEGETKIFAENAYILTKENLETIKIQLSSFKDNSKQGPDSVLEIVISKQDLKDKVQVIKKILDKYPGLTTVYLRVGQQTIRVKQKIDYNSSLIKDLQDLGLKYKKI